MISRLVIWGFLKFGVPSWSSFCKGILLFRKPPFRPLLSGLSLACAVYQCCAKPILDEQAMCSHYFHSASRALAVLGVVGYVPVQDFKNKKRKMEARKAAGKKN